MEANELRLGNLVNYGVNIVPIKSIHTESVLKDEVKVYVELTPKLQNYCLDITEIGPIQLTEEHLLNLGFTQCGYESLFWCHEKLKGLQFAGINWADIEFPEYQFLNYEVGGVIYQIRYVHQLQNLYFILIGEELTFKSE